MRLPYRPFLLIIHGLLAVLPKTVEAQKQQLLRSNATVDDDGGCGLWMGPSIIKEKEAHGFGFGIYTGKTIPRGTMMQTELFLPIFDMDDKAHPPFREYLWSGRPHKEIALEVDRLLLYFLPGLGAIAPCTSNNYSLKRIKSNVIYDNAGVHRKTDPTAGSFTYYQQPMFQAVRDIQPGEELTVECPDDDFDGEPHSLVKYDPEERNDIQICLDDKLVEGESKIPKVGQGVMAKKDLEKDDVLTSSPAVPIAQSLLWHEKREQYQQIINYCYGHPNSDLLWLPYGSFFNAINHAPTPEQVNVKVQWHKQPVSTELSRRQEYHHPELLDLATERVASTHGKGLVMDLVALRDIKEGEELYLDYGEAWSKAWKDHVANWKDIKDSETYVAPVKYNHDLADEPIRTITEQHRDPYPHNMVTACRYTQDWITDEYAEDYDMVQYHSWKAPSQKGKHDRCLLPCLVLERMELPPTEGSEDKKGKDSYTVKLVDHHQKNDSIEWKCHIFRRFEYIIEDVPRIAIEFVDQKYASDTFLEKAFRQPIQVSDGMYPEHWMRQRVRRRTTEATAEELEEEEAFKRKSIGNKDRAKTKALSREEL